MATPKTEALKKKIGKVKTVWDAIEQGDKEITIDGKTYQITK